MSKKASMDNIFGTTTKVFGLIAIFSGMYGVSYQKGMIIAMGLGNLNGNYDIREIFNSAIEGYIMTSVKLMNINFTEVIITG